MSPAKARRSKLSVEWCYMSTAESVSQAAQAELEEKLREADERLITEMRARGFDPAQAENLALTGQLAKLYMERERLQEALDILVDSTNSTGG
jgi:hypothetical protein